MGSKGVKSDVPLFQSMNGIYLVTTSYLSFRMIKKMNILENTEKIFFHTVFNLSFYLMKDQVLVSMNVYF